MTSLSLAPAHRFVEHGGEVEVELTAHDEAGILAAALDAFAELVGTEGGEPASVDVELPVHDRVLLLADWLEELLFLAEAEQFVPRAITAIDIGTHRLRATIAGTRGSPRPLVKGVALGGARFEREGELWHGRVVLDV